MGKLRRKFDRFCFNHRSKGIPNLMLFVAIGSAVTTMMAHLGYTYIYEILRFDYIRILKGEVWRLVTYVFTTESNILSALITAYCYYFLGRAVESAMGTFKFNLYYFSSILLMDIFLMAVGGETIDIFHYPSLVPSVQSITAFYADFLGMFHHLALVLCFATLYPDTQFLLFFLIPIRAWVLALFYMIYLVFSVADFVHAGLLFPHYLFPLIPILNYLLFFGKDCLNIIPGAWKYKGSRPKTVRHTPPKKESRQQSGSIPFDRGAQKGTQSYTHRCTVCGRTDVTNPELEFRYCSKCNGYYCYCEEHIGNHTHVQ